MPPSGRLQARHKLLAPSHARNSAPPIRIASSEPGQTASNTDNPRPHAMAMVELASGGAERRHVPGAAAAFERVAHDDGRRRSGRDDEDERERERTRDNWNRSRVTSLTSSSTAAFDVASA